MSNVEFKILSKMCRRGGKYWHARMQALRFVGDHITHIERHPPDDTEVPSVIWFYWSDGYDRAPRIVRNCFDVLKKNNPKFSVNFIDDSNISEFVDLIPEFYNVRISHVAHFSDILRVELLRSYGGYWIDATVLVNCSIDCLIPSSARDFFVFSRFDNHIISSWFIKSSPGAYQIEAISKILHLWWEKNSELPSYYWFHHIYEALVIQDPLFADLHRSMTKASALPSLNATRYLSRQKLSIFEYWFVKNFPLHKLTHKSELSLFSFSSKSYCYLSKLFKAYVVYIYHQKKILRILKNTLYFSSPIFVFHGGLGNQLFQYAFMKNKLKDFSKKPQINLDFYCQDYSFDRKYLISDLTKEFELNSSLSFSAVRFLRLLSNVLRQLSLKGFIVHDDVVEPAGKRRLGLLVSNLYFGYWQDRKISPDAIFEIQAMLKSYKISECLDALVADAERGGIIFLHVRRGDYLDSNGFHSVLSKNYYINALDLLNKRVKNLRKVYVFSDDVDWCYINIVPLIGVECVIVSSLNTSKDALAELKVMSVCSGGIIANSTYSWWGAMIGRSNQGQHTVIAPSGYLLPNDFSTEREKEWLLLPPL